MKNKLTKQRICVLGASGSIGSRLVSMLVSQGYQVTALVRSLSSAVRIGRFDIQIQQLDLLKATTEQLSSIMKGHDVVIDCTYSVNSDYQQRVQEAKQLAELICAAARQSQIPRLIHYGTISVYPANAGVIDETIACSNSGDSYADSKLIAEQIFLAQHCASLAITVLQLPIVFGPFMGWSISPVAEMTECVLLMPNDLKGSCSPIFVDDVANATILAFDCDQSYGEKILLSDAAMSWFDYYQAYAQLSAKLTLSAMQRDEFNATQSQQAFSQRPFQILKSKFSTDGDFRQMVLSQWGIRTIYSMTKRLRGQGGLEEIKTKLASSLLPEEQKQRTLINLQRLQVMDTLPQVRSDKAKRILNFEPAQSFSESISITKEWLKWARLVD